MEYIFITLLAITATTCLVYLLANKVFNIRLRLKSLVLCAACAIFLSLVLPRIIVSFAGLAGTVGFLALFAVIFAYFVACYDEPAEATAGEHPGQPEAAPAAEAVFAVATIADKEPSPDFAAPPAPAPVDPLPPAVPALAVAEADSLDEYLPEPQTADDAQTPLDLFAGPLYNSHTTVDNEPEAENELAEEATDVETQPEPAPAMVPFPEEAGHPGPEPEISAETAPEAEAAANIADCLDLEMGLNLIASTEDEVSDSQAAGETDDSRPESAADFAPLAALAENREGETVEAADAEPFPEEFAVNYSAEPPSDNLDDLLEFAFVEKDRGNFALALDTFRRAFKRYRYSQAGPLLSIEIAGLLKMKGAYDEAVTLLSDSRSLPALQQNAALDQEFIDTIAFLRIVKNTLLQNHIGFVPFERIPADIAKEIDDEFREWRNLA